MDGHHLAVKQGSSRNLHRRLRHLLQQTRRTRVAKALQSWGYRIQESVFQLRLDAAGLNAMRARLAALINEAEDVVHIYPLCSTCAERAEILGAAVALDDVGLCRGCGEESVILEFKRTIPPLVKTE